MTSKRIAYVQLGSFSHANHYIARSLRKHFPDYEIDIIDVAVSLRANKRVRLLNLLHTLKEYGKEILLGRRKPRECMYHTSYLFRMMSKWSRQAIAPHEYAFSIQTQSMFDASQPDLPHFVYTDHTLLAHLRYPHLKQKQAYIASRSWLMLETALYRNAAANFAMGEFVAQSLREDYGCPREQVICARAGANIGTPNPVLIAKYTRKEILFVGVRWARKGGPDLLEAFKRVLQKHPDAQLTIVGCSPAIDPMVHPNCRVLGKVERTEVAKLYEQASIFCLPTTLEPFGFVFIEAMMHKLPVVATNIGAIPDFVKDNVSGHLVEPGDTNALADSLIDLLDSPSRCLQFGKAAHRAVIHRYTWDAAVATIKEKIVAVLNEEVEMSDALIDGPCHVNRALPERTMDDEMVRVGHRRPRVEEPSTRHVENAPIKLTVHGDVVRGLQE